MPTVLAPAIRTSPFSFVRFNDQHLDDADWAESQIPGASLGFSLPVSRPDDLMYQFIWESDDIGDVDSACAISLASFSFKLARGASHGPSINHAGYLALPSAGTFTGADLSIERYRLDDNQILFFVPKISNIGLFNGLAEGDCFQIAVDEPILGMAAISNAFYYSTAIDFTTLIDYYSDYDEADFYYCISPTLKNRVRLPLYLTAPTYPEDESIYRRSDGLTIIQKALVREVFDVVVDELPNWAIQSLRAIFIHDGRFVACRPHTGSVAKEGPFDVAWPDFLNYPFGKVSFKVSTDTNLMKNNNCGDCADPGYDIVLTPYTIPGTGISNHTYIVALAPLLVATCCDPTTYSIFSHTGYVTTFSISGSTLTLHTGTLPPSVGIILLSITASCGSVTSAPVDITIVT